MKNKIDWWTFLWRLMMAAFFMWHFIRCTYVATEINEIVTEGFRALLWVIIITIRINGDRFDRIEDRITEVEQQTKQDQDNKCKREKTDSPDDSECYYE